MTRFVGIEVGAKSVPGYARLLFNFQDVLVRQVLSLSKPCPNRSLRNTQHAGGRGLRSNERNSFSEGFGRVSVRHDSGSYSFSFRFVNMIMTIMLLKRKL